MARARLLRRIALSVAVAFAALAGLFLPDAITALGAAQPSGLGNELSDSGPRLLFGGGAPDAHRVFGEAWTIIQKYYLFPSAAEPRHLLLAAATALTERGANPESGRAAPGGDAPSLDLWKQTYDGIRRMVQSLRDPNSVFLTPDERRVVITGFEGRLEGIGACLDVSAGYAIVRGVVEGSPAEHSGLRAGDLILAIDGQPVEGREAQDVILAVRGPAGTTVRLTTRHSGRAALIELTIERAEIRLVSAKGKLAEPGIGLLRLSGFTESTDEETGAVLDELSRQGTRALILDLRGNLGGLLEPAVAVASRFIGTSPIVWQENSRGQRYGYERIADEPLIGWPMAVLVDRNSASASEVLALVLRDAGRARLVGESTYGKGTIQYLFELSDGSGLHLTSARWVSPSGSRLEPSGLAPDVQVVADRADQSDPAANQAVSLLRPAIAAPAAGPPEPATLPLDECTPRSANAA